MLDFAIWERDQINPAAYGEWLAAIAAAPFERIGRWMKGIDSELLGLILRRGAAIYDLSEGAPPEEPEGTFYPTPDGFFVLDVRVSPVVDDGPDPARALITLIDALYRTDHEFARHMIVGAIGELDAELEESAYRWRQARMADLGFADYYEALEVYRELDPATVRIGDVHCRPARARSSTRARRPTARRCGSRRRWPRDSATRTARRSPAPPRSSPPATSWMISASRWSRSPTACSPPTGSRPATTRRCQRCSTAWWPRSIWRWSASRKGTTSAARRRCAPSRWRGCFAWASASAARSSGSPSPCAVKVRSARRGSIWPRATTRRSSRPSAACGRCSRGCSTIRPPRASGRSAISSISRGRPPPSSKPPRHRRWCGASASRPRMSRAGGPALAGTGVDVAGLDLGMLARTALVARLLDGGETKRAAQPARFRPLAPDQVKAFEAMSKAPRSKDKAPKLPGRAREERPRDPNRSRAEAARRGRGERRHALARHARASRAGAGERPAEAAPEVVPPTPKSQPPRRQRHWRR